MSVRVQRKDEVDLDPLMAAAASRVPERAAIVVNDLQPYGSQRVAVALARALMELQVSTTVVTIEPSDRDGLELPDGVDRCSVLRRRRGAAGYVQVVTELRGVVATCAPDVVISHMVFANVCVLAATILLPRHRIPVIATEHNIPSRNLPLERSTKALTWLARRLYPRARRVVGVSNAVVADATSTYGLKPGHALRIFNPVDVGLIRKAGQGPPPHPWLEPPSAARTVVCVGGFRHAKGQDVLVRALAAVPNVHALFVGDGERRAAAEQLAQTLGVTERVAFVGYRDDALVFIRHAAALVVPSRWEGFGLVAVEAAALGVPLIASAIAPLMELVPEYVPGRLVAPDDPGELGEAIRITLAGNPPEGKRRLETFDPHMVARQYLAAAQG